ncbi:MAG TPA: hypothetical protein VFA98_03060, partial [Thermoanaerobaculia bacterium]|nr:hypothetical protein [Thermoanaerobaculia bacterium]
MRKTLVSLASLLLLAAAASAAPCTPSARSLCLSGGRFEVSVVWTDFQNNTGDGQAIPLTADTGYFWFFNASNVELIVKVLDATAINGKFWVFFGALSNVEYTLTVRDSVTGASRQYHNSSGQFASVGDTTAFSGSVHAPPSTERVVVRGTSASPESVGVIQRLIDRSVSSASMTKDAKDVAPCPSVGSALVLTDCRFAVTVDWTDFQGNTGRGTPMQLTDDTGYFWFFNSSNVELVVKVLDARPVNGSFWVFFGALSNVSYTVTVTDTLSGAAQTYTNAAGTFASVGDTGAFKAGPTVHPVTDASRAVSADIDAAGGSLTVTGADGTLFTLAIPQNALGSSVTISMAPISSIAALPLSQGLVGGVQIEPEGLGLFVPATLTINSPTPLRPNAAGFSYLGDGQEFALDINQVNGN